MLGLCCCTVPPLVAASGDGCLGCVRPGSAVACSLWTLQCGLSSCAWAGCTAAHGIFPDQSSNPCSLRWQVILNHWTTKQVPLTFFLSTSRHVPSTAATRYPDLLCPPDPHSSSSLPVSWCGFVHSPKLNSWAHLSVILKQT